MCNQGYHNCSICGEEIKCYQSNSECAEFNGFQGQPCEKCEYWQEELERDEQEKEQRRREYEYEIWGEYNPFDED